MKNYIRILIIMVALMWGAVSGTWAQLGVSDVEIDVKPGASAGTATASVNAETREVTLTVTPASGYYIKASDIIVEKLIDPGKANTPKRRTPAITDVITGKMYSGSERTDEDIISSVEYPNSAQYVFTVPADYDGAYVTATFHLLTEDNIIRITASTNLGNSPDMTKHYILVEDVSATVVENLYSTTAFTGTFEGEAQADGSFPKITGLQHALFQTVNGGTVKNIVLDNVSIGGSTTITGDTKTATGAIANIATGSSRIYNCGVQATTSTVKTDEDGYTHIDVCSSKVGANSDYVGGIVGFLDGTSRVINCYSYANITGGTNVGGIVGYNNVATTASNLQTMVMNCMFYGDITGGTNKAPIYNGLIISNVGNTGVGNYNYFNGEASYVVNQDIQTSNCALMAEIRFLQRFEFFRHLQNSHRKLAAWWATGNYSDKDEMAKWVLLPSQIGSSIPYPVLKAPGYYPSVVNIDAKNATHATERNKGGKMGTLSVNIQMGSGGAVFGAPTGATITKPYLTLNITDKDFDHFNFNYYKVQLPYYNDVGTKNYTGNRVVTGWKIVSITGGTPGTYTESDSWGGYNFADRNCTNKDLYSTSHRVFNQGAYWDVPEGVTAITIEPYWAKAAYLADENADMVYNTDMSTSYKVPDVGGGKIYNNGSSYSIVGNSQKVYTSLGNAVNNGLSCDDTYTVNDYAVVLVGNYHHVVSTNNGSVSASHPYTVTSVDLDGDDEPDYSLTMRNNGRNPWHPVKWDFINIPGLGMAQKSTGTSAEGSYNLGIVVPTNWFETTNTALFRVTQFEYERSQNHTTPAPYILQGGVMEQWVTGQQNASPNNITYFLVGGNVWFKEFHRGVHQDNTASSNHPPVSVTGGDFDKFYLTGLYRADVTSYGDNAECYINGGRFGEVAGAAMEGIGKAKGADNTGNVTWQIQNADIKEFYGGGLNADRPVTGNISTTIIGGKIDLFCGGPKFGDMSTGKTVVTNATGCEFGTFFGAGYGGSSYSRRAPSNIAKMINMPGTTNDKKTYNTWNAWVTTEYKQESAGTKFPGISTQFSYQFIPNSNNSDNVGRLFVEHVLFSLATTRDVTSTLTNCIITGNFYGGGSLGKVDGPVTSTLTDCIIKGNVFGAGYSASLPTVEVDSIGFRVEPVYYTDYGTYRKGVKGKTTTYQWQHGNAVGIDTDKKILYTTEDLDGLGVVTGKATLTINGTTTVGESIYGGGEESAVGGDTHVTVNSGRIGVENTGRFGYRWGNVYGGGKGKIKIKSDGNSELAVENNDDLNAGLVRGNTNVTINGTETTTQILHNVYGGGAIGSVGTFTRGDDGMPTACAANTGLATVTINGGKIGHDHQDTGMVNGSSRGWEGDPKGEGAFAFLDQLAWVNNTNVIIGDPDSDEEDKGPSIWGSVFGGGENGHNFENGVVTVNKGTIGDEEGTWDCGNIYGAGCGTDTYTIGEDPTKHHNPMAGLVRGTTSITINGGHVLRNVYGGGSMGSVGTYTYDGNGLPTTCAAGTGNTTININGGTIGADDSEYGNVYGGPKGNLNEREFFASVRETEVNINPHPTDTSKPGANVKGSVFGGGEAGIVKEKVVVNMLGGTVERDVYGGGALANTNTNVSDDASAKTLNTTVNLHGGTINRNVYGGGLGRQARAGKDAVGTEGQEDYEPAVEPLSAVEAKVKGDVLVELNGKKVIGEGGTEEWPDNCVVKGDIFGCNNLNGSPQHAVTVHIFKTVGYEGHEGTASDKLDSSNKADHSYHVSAVYGGGNLAAFMPDVKSVVDTVQARVIIDGCDMTSIRQVYGGGNAASAPATNITVNGTYEIEEVFGGGNGLDDITINNVTMANPGANVGYKNYSTYDSEKNVWNDNTDADTKEERQAQNSPYVYGTGIASINIYDGRIHRVFGGSNTKGNVRKTAVTLLDDMGGCHFCIDEAYGGGKSASMDAEAQLLMACIPGLNAVYGGAEEADINDNVTLNITNGTFKRVFGGNNLSGTIRGSITVNVEETGCRPVVIGELYGGGNQAGYSVYGYKEVEVNDEKVWMPRESANDDGTGPATPYADPQVNAKSFTSIGAIYGGGYGDGATMVGNPTVNINEVVGKFATTGENSSDYDEDGNYKGKTITVDDHEVDLPPHSKGKIGAIGKVFGGGNAAMVMGNTHVNVATQGTIDFVTKDRDDTTGTQPQTGVTVQGADIRGNVYGGGNAAEVTGDANVVIGKSEPTPSPNPAPTPTPEPTPEP